MVPTEGDVSLPLMIGGGVAALVLLAGAMLFIKRRRER